MLVLVLCIAASLIQLINRTFHKHAALGGDWPRLQPLSGVHLRHNGEAPVLEGPGRRQ